MKRRDFINKTAKSALGITALGAFTANASIMNNLPFLKDSLITSKDLFFKISLAQWSLHKALFAKEMDNLDFAAKSRSFNCEGLEYVNAFFKDKAKDKKYLTEMNHRAKSEGQKNVLIMIDGEGSMAHADKKERLKAIENHHKWVDAAHFLGCHAIRVNLAGGKDKSEAVKASIDSLTRLSDYAKGSNINILVENHGGFSSDGDWMTQVFSQVKNKNCGTLPDFGNFCIKKNSTGCSEEYDRYKGMQQLLPFAKAVSAKSHDFNAQGDEIHTDFYKVMKMVKDVGYTGYVGIEYEGSKVSEEEGIILTRDLLIKAGKKLS